MTATSEAACIARLTVKAAPRAPKDGVSCMLSKIFCPGSGVVDWMEFEEVVKGRVVVYTVRREPLRTFDPSASLGSCGGGGNFGAVTSGGVVE